jgi:hypothetical protein
MGRLIESTLPPPLGILPVLKDKQVGSYQNKFYVHALRVMFQETIYICINITVNVSKPKQVNKFKTF